MRLSRPWLTATISKSSDYTYGEASLIGGASLDTIPASVYGFAAVAGPILLAKMTPEQAIIPTVLSIVIGAVFGYLSEMLANALSKKGEPTAEATADPEHA